MYTERWPICLLIIYVLQAELEHSVVKVVNPAQCGTATTTTSTTPSLMIVQPKYEAKELWKFTVGDIFFLNMHQLARGTSRGIQVEWNYSLPTTKEKIELQGRFFTIWKWTIQELDRIVNNGKGRSRDEKPLNGVYTFRMMGGAYWILSLNVKVLDSLIGVLTRQHNLSDRR